MKSLRLAFALALVAPVCLACASTPSADTPSPGTTATATSAAAEDEDAALPPSDVPEIVKREETATKYVGVLKTAPSDEQAARVAMSGISEEVFQLPPGLRKAMEAVWSGQADASQTGTIALAAADEDQIIKQSMSRWCGRAWTEFHPAFEKLSPKEKTKTLLVDCGGAKLLKVDAALAEHLNWGAVLFSMSTVTLLEARGRISKDERTLARKIAHAFRDDQKS